jgi:ubiquinone/menaquinone biosynthesis C-methylase UbiE
MYLRQTRQIWRAVLRGSRTRFAMSTTYLMESAGEAGRLEAKTLVEETRRHLTLAGIAPGMRALDAGAGTGAVARELARMVGPSGSVVALDQSAHRLSEGEKLAGLSNLEFVQGDLYAPPLPEGTFDFIWCRFVYEYLSDPDLATQQLVRLLKPGGKLVVGDLDGNIVWHHPSPPGFEEELAKVMRALEGRFDPFAGRKLFHRFRKAGLRDIKVHHLPYHLIAGPATQRDLDNWAAKVETIRPAGEKALGSKEAYDRLGAQLLALLRDPDALTYSTLFLVEGVR